MYIYNKLIFRSIVFEEDQFLGKEELKLRKMENGELFAI